MTVDIIIDSKEDLKDYSIIEGFPGIGLVGTIAAGYIVEKRKMKQIGYIYSKEFPPIISIHEGKASFPVRIYKDSQKKLLVVLSEFIIPTNTIYDLAESITNFAKEKKIKRIISLAGMTSSEKTNKVFAIASDEEIAREITKKRINLVKEGVTTGVSGVLIAKCTTEKIPATILLVESDRNYPDPAASAKLIKTLNELLGISINIKELLEEATKIESKMRSMINQMKKSKASYEKAETLPMYG